MRWTDSNSLPFRAPPEFADMQVQAGTQLVRFRLKRPQALDPALALYDISTRDHWARLLAERQKRLERYSGFVEAVGEQFRHDSADVMHTAIGSVSDASAMHKNNAVSKLLTHFLELGGKIFGSMLAHTHYRQRPNPISKHSP